MTFSKEVPRIIGSRNKLYRLIVIVCIVLLIPIFFVKFRSGVNVRPIPRSHVRDTFRWQKNRTLDQIVKNLVNVNEDLMPKPDDMVKLSNYINPCWKKRDSEDMYCLPAYYFGGFAKCSTTDLWRRLLLHPQISDTGITVNDQNTSPLKEYQYWTVSLFKDHKPLKEYMSMFDNVTHHPDMVVGDGSVGIFANKYIMYRAGKYYPQGSDVQTALRNLEISAPHVIVQYVPNAKFIVMVREPGARVYSYYLHQLRHEKYATVPGYHHPSPKQFHLRVVKRIDEFEKCMLEKTALDCGSDGDIFHDEKFDRVSLRNGLYAATIKDAMKLVPRENIIVFRSEDYILYRREVMAQIVEFIGLRVSEDIMDKLDVDVHIRNSKDASEDSFAERVSDVAKMPMWPETRKLLSDFYEPFNQELAELMDDERFSFKDVL